MLKPAICSTSLLCFGLLAAINSQAEELKCGVRITENTTLTADLDCSGFNGNALIIDGSNVVLNGAGHKITTTVGGTSAVVVNTLANNVTVENLVVDAPNSVGIKVDGDNALIINNTVDKANLGILISKSGKVIKNKIRNSTGNGIKIDLAEKSNDLQLSINHNDLQNSVGCALYISAPDFTLTGLTNNNLNGSNEAFCIKGGKFVIKNLSLANQLIYKRHFVIDSVESIVFSNVNVSSIAPSTAEQQRAGIDMYRVKYFKLENVVANCNDVGAQVQNEVQNGQSVLPVGEIINSIFKGNVFAGVHVVIHDVNSKYGKIMVCENKFAQESKNKSIIVRSEKSPETPASDFSDVTTICDGKDLNQFKAISSNSTVCDPSGRRPGSGNGNSHNGHKGHKGNKKASSLL